jgi:membrane fusion protein (multidrug efflux system)
MSRTRKITLLVLGVAVAGALVAGWVFRDRLSTVVGGMVGENGGPPRGRPPPLVATAPVQTLRIESRISTTGTLTATEAVTVTARSRGRVAEVLFREGEAVATGEPLLRLERARAEARVDEARAQLEERRRDLARLRELGAQQFVSASELEQAEAAVETARAALTVAAEDLADRVIEAPFDGVVGRRLVSPGALLEPGSPVASLSRLEPLDLVLEVPGTAVGEVEPGQRVQATTPAYPDQRFTGEISFVGTEVNRATRTLTLEATFPNTEGLLKPGMFMQADLITGTRDALTVPEAAVIARGPTQHLFVLQQPDDPNANDSAKGATGSKTVRPAAGRAPPVAERRKVDTGTRRAGWVEIIDGVSAGERVLVAGLQTLRDGMAVRTGPPQQASSADAQPGAAAADQRARPPAPAEAADAPGGQDTPGSSAASQERDQGRGATP